jgi:GWxTD domain-containing protein
MIFDQRSRSSVLLLAVLLLTAVPALAALSPQYTEWGAGPAQWIMSADEKRAWRNVTTDNDAILFIDLFWARRDPTPGTAFNERRHEFDSRVVFADEYFREKRKRGALTDRGRVYIVLGAPTNMANAVNQTNDQMGVAPGESSGSRQRGTRDTWIWEYADAQKFDMGRIEVVFVENPTSGSRQRDPHRPDFGLADRVALKKSIAQPDLTAVPAWAATGGLRPLAPMAASEVPETAEAAPPPPAIATASTQADAGEPAPGGPAVASSAPGVSRLTLLPRGSINARSATDPFATTQPEAKFKGGSDGHWAVQYCSAVAAVPPLKFLLLITGPLDGASKEQATREKEAKPERMTAHAGCYVLQGTFPSSKLTPGRYKLTVMIDDGSGESQKARGEFRVE